MIGRYWEEISTNNERKIIDQACNGRLCRNGIEDVRVRRNPQINNDHYLLEVWTKILQENTKNKWKRKRLGIQIPEKETIELYRFN